VVTPFILYLPAEMLGGSGVVAVVAGGLTLSVVLSRVVTAQSRTLGFDFWRVASYVLNGALFVLIGLQARTVIDIYVHGDGVRALLLTLAVTAAVFVVRLLWVTVMAPLIRLLDRRPSQRERRVPFRIRAVIVWGGLRGAVSLAAALSVPAVVADGADFPDRELLVAVTFGVIVLLLVVQGATLPLVVQRARIPAEDTEQKEFELAVTTMTRHALDGLDADAAATGASAEVRASVRHQLEHALDDHGTSGDAAGTRALRLKAIARKRAALERPRATQRIDDGVFLRVQEDLDHEELRLHDLPG
jgi:CPA1 family monovalent cation:H+ antiporter